MVQLFADGTTYTASKKSLPDVSSIWSKTTLITFGVGGTGVDLKNGESFNKIFHQTRAEECLKKMSTFIAVNSACNKDSFTPHRGHQVKTF